MTGASHFTDSSKHLSNEEKAALQQLVQGSIAVREITIIDDDANAVSLLSENYEEIEDYLNNIREFNEKEQSKIYREWSDAVKYGIDRMQKAKDLLFQTVKL